MSNHWESSARPLSVRTVFVNGHRHAILFEEDPLHHCGSSTVKKISRSNSSLSSASDQSVTSSESQDSNLEERLPTTKLRNSEQRQGKDLSSELQSCLIKFRLASANLENKTKSTEEKCFCHSKEPERSQKEISKQKKHKHKLCRRKHHCEYLQGDSKENKLIGKSFNKSSSCYFYNCESSQRKKNYCVVKISSQSPKFTLSCRCDLSETHKCKALASDKNKMVISATIHNLFMTTRKEQLFDNKVDKTFFCENIDSIDLYWNSYLTRSYYNSLSDRVFQWLDLASKRKNQKQKLNSTQEEDTSNSTERIFSGKTFVGANKNTEHSDKFINKERNNAVVKKGESKQQETSKKEESAGVHGEVNKKLFSCREKLQGDSPERFEEETTIIPLKSSAESQQESAMASVPEETHTDSPEIILKRWTVPTKTLKIQDLLLSCNVRENLDIPFGERNTRKIRGSRESSAFRSKRKELFSNEEEEGNVMSSPLKYWENRTVRKSHQFDITGKQTTCHCNRIFDECSDKIDNKLLTEGFTERNQKSINNLNITRAQPVLIQNLLPPRHQDEITSLTTEKAVWGSEKDTKRPQLHIFMPTLLLKDTSDDSLSECENVLNVC